MELKTKIILTIVSVFILMIVGFPSIYGTFALLCDLKAYGVDETCLMCIKALREMNLYGAIIGKAYYTGAIDLKTAIEVAK